MKRITTFIVIIMFICTGCKVGDNSKNNIDITSSIAETTTSETETTTSKAEKTTTSKAEKTTTSKTEKPPVNYFFKQRERFMSQFSDYVNITFDENLYTETENKNLFIPYRNALKNQKYTLDFYHYDPSEGDYYNPDLYVKNYHIQNGEEYYGRMDYAGEKYKYELYAIEYYGVNNHYYVKNEYNLGELIEQDSKWNLFFTIAAERNDYFNYLNSYVYSDGDLTLQCEVWDIGERMKLYMFFDENNIFKLVKWEFERKGVEQAMPTFDMYFTRFDFSPNTERIIDPTIIQDAIILDDSHLYDEFSEN